MGVRPHNCKGITKGVGALPHNSVECVLAFVLSLGFQLKHKATCHGGGGLTRHSHYVRVRLGARD